jgi:type II secretory pathway pseudopilin PulG
LLIAVPSFLAVRDKAEARAVQSNISSAIPAAETYYQANYGSPLDADSNGLTNGYTGTTRALLVAQAQNLAPSLQIAVSPGGTSYCLEDTEGSSTYHYVGGSDASVVAHGATIFSSTCPTLL